MTPSEHNPAQQALFDSMKLQHLLLTPRIEQANQKVDRRAYGPIDTRLAMIDAPQSIGYNATISEMHKHVMCLELLQNQLHDGTRGLDIGSGSGYLTAV